jgi:quinol monooxygenase YgiN
VNLLITATLRITVSKSKNADVMRLLRSLIGPTRVETGCLTCRLYQDVNSPNTLTWVEQWNSQEDLNKHLKSAQYNRILAALDMSDVEPEIHLARGLGTTG